MIHVYTGDGKGKTTVAVGLAVRMAGYDKNKVLFMQFLTGRYTGEMKMLEASHNIRVMRCDKNYGFYGKMSDSDKAAITASHNNNINYALEHMNEYEMIVLDELFVAVGYGLVDIEAVKRIVRTYGGELVMTGRNPDEWFLKKADYISEIKNIRHPYDKGVAARRGIEY